MRFVAQNYGVGIRAVLTGGTVLAIRAICAILTIRPVGTRRNLGYRHLVIYTARGATYGHRLRAAPNRRIVMCQGISLRSGSRYVRERSLSHLFIAPLVSGCPREGGRQRNGGRCGIPRKIVGVYKHLVARHPHILGRRTIRTVITHGIHRCRVTLLVSRHRFRPKVFTFLWRRYGCAPASCRCRRTRTSYLVSIRYRHDAVTVSSCGSRIALVTFGSVSSHLTHAVRRRCGIVRVGYNRARPKVLVGCHGRDRTVPRSCGRRGARCAYLISHGGTFDAFPIRTVVTFELRPRVIRWSIALCGRCLVYCYADVLCRGFGSVIHPAARRVIGILYPCVSGFPVSPFCPRHALVALFAFDK